MNTKKEFFYTDRETVNSVHDLILRAYRKYPDVIFCKYLINGVVNSKTYAEMYHTITLIGQNIKETITPGRHVVLIGNTSFEWLSSYLGMLYHGIPVIPIDRQLSKEVLLNQIDFADSEVMLYDNKYKDIAEYIKLNSAVCKRFINFDERGDDEYFGDIINTQKSFDESKIMIDPKQLAEIVFTSGTTGISKGVMLSHENLACAINSGIRCIKMNPGNTLLSIMPNNHTYELTVGVISPIYFGMSIAINDSLKNLINNIKLFKPSSMVVVPALLKIMQKEILTGVKKKKKTFAFKFAISLKKFAGLFHIDISKKLFAEIHEIFGGKIENIICGGAFLKTELIDFFDDLGIKIIEGYGITECSPVVSCNTDRCSKRKTLGKVIPYCTVRCFDGEICVSGQNVMMGYYKNPALTAEVLKDGWFKTGDLGFIDDEGFLKMTGRKKNLIILSNGENVCPEELENLLDDIEIVDTGVVYEKDEMITVEIYPKESYIKEKNITDVYNAVCREIYALNATLPVYKQMNSIVVRNEPFIRTTTLKIKRDELKKPAKPPAVNV